MTKLTPERQAELDHMVDEATGVTAPRPRKAKRVVDTSPCAAPCVYLWQDKD